MPVSKNTSLIAGIVAVSVLLFVGLAWILIKTPADPSAARAGEPENVSFNDEGSPSIGLATSNVIVHLFSDFQCPACRYAEPAVKAAIEAYKDRVKFVWKDFPLETLHPNARIASEAARCAVDQNKFWEYHDRLYSNQSDWDSLPSPTNKLVEEATAIGIEPTAFRACLQARAHTDLVKRDIDEGFDNDVDRTPTVFINNRRYFAMSTAEWQKNLDAALAEASSTQR